MSGPYNRYSRFYLADQIGAGTEQDPRRCLLHDMGIFNWEEDTFEEVDNPSSDTNLICVWTTQANHTILESTPGVEPITDVMEEGADKIEKLGRTFGQTVAANARAMAKMRQAKMDVDRFSPDIEQAEFLTELIADLLEKQQMGKAGIHKVDRRFIEMGGVKKEVRQVKDA